MFFNFVWDIVNRFTTGFELIRAGRSPGLATWEETKNMNMFLRCLQVAVGGHNYSGACSLWWSGRKKPERLDQHAQAITSASTKHWSSMVTVGLKIGLTGLSTYSSRVLLMVFHLRVGLSSNDISSMAAMSDMFFGLTRRADFALE
jgi:hypothetical protein